MKDDDMMKQRIVLIGFMGVGKTTVGHQLASNLNFDSVDIDREIEKKFLMKTTDIFNQLGENFFREAEKKLTCQWLNANQKVLSLGGGAFLQKELKEACLNASIVIYLETTWNVWQQRLAELAPTRPLLQEKSLREIKELYFERLTYYQDHHLKVNVDGLTSEETTHQLLNKLNGALNLADNYAWMKHYK